MHINSRENKLALTNIFQKDSKLKNFIKKGITVVNKLKKKGRKEQTTLNLTYFTPRVSFPPLSR
jgi:hypothetical protein